MWDHGRSVHGHQTCAFFFIITVRAMLAKSLWVTIYIYIYIYLYNVYGLTYKYVVPNGVYFSVSLEKKQV